MEGAATAAQVPVTCSGNNTFTLDGFFESVYDGCYAPADTEDTYPSSFTLGGVNAEGISIIPWDADGALNAVRCNRRGTVATPHGAQAHANIAYGVVVVGGHKISGEYVVEYVLRDKKSYFRCHNAIPIHVRGFLVFCCFGVL